MIGLDADPVHTALAHQYVRQYRLANVEVVTTDARHTGLPPDLSLIHI